MRGKEHTVIILCGEFSEILSIIQFDKEARRLRLHPEFKLRRWWAIGSSPSYPSFVRFDRSCTGFKPSQAERKSRKVSGYRGVGVRDIKNSVDKRLGKSIVKTPKQFRAIHLLGYVAGIENHRHLISLETKSQRPFESQNSERITAMDLKKDTCCVIIQTRDLAIGAHISEWFDFVFGEDRGLI